MATRGRVAGGGRSSPRLNDTEAISRRSVGDFTDGLYGTERRFRRDRALEAAMAEAVVDSKPLPEVFRPTPLKIDRGHLAGDERLSTAKKELEKK